MKELSKGSIIFVDNWWFVVVEQDENDLYCICDNANNIYSFKLEEPKFVATAKQAMTMRGWGYAIHDADEEFNDKLIELNSKRSIPAEVIAEVLAGCHDNRFDHWKEHKQKNDATRATKEGTK